MEKNNAEEPRNRKKVSKSKKVRFMNALAIEPHDVLSTGNMYNVTIKEGSDAVTVPTVTECTSGTCSRESRTVRPNVFVQ